MPREPMGKSEAKVAEREKRQYTLRKGYSMPQGNEMLHGPEIVHLSLKQAYLHKHMMAERADIEKEWNAQQDAVAKAQRDLEMQAARARAGLPAEPAGTT